MLMLQFMAPERGIRKFNLNRVLTMLLISIFFISNFYFGDSLLLRFLFQNSLVRDRVVFILSFDLEQFA